MAEICSIDQPLQPADLVRRVRLPDGTEVEVVLTEAERRRAFDGLRDSPQVDDGA